LTNGEYDNIALPNGGSDFEIKIGFINQKGSAKFSGGRLTGLQTMRRSSSVKLEPVVSFCLTTMSNLLQICNFEFMGACYYTARVTGTVANVKVRIVLLVDKTGTIQLEKFNES